MTRARAALAWVSLLLATVACGEDDPKPPQSPAPLIDAELPPPYIGEGGALEDRITIPLDPRDAAITEPTPILDLPLVIARPNAPLSTSTLEVMVIDPMGTPIGQVGVSTGGPAVLTNGFGLATVNAVYGADFADVYAFGSSITLGHARVTIRPGQASSVVLMVARSASLRVADLALRSELDLEVSASRQLRATFPAGAFELPWGGSAKGPAYVRLAALGERRDAGALPGDMLARVGGELVPLTGVVAFEVRVVQGATELALIDDATVVVTWPAQALAIELAARQLYFFDPEQGVFVERGALDVSSSAATGAATIDRLGMWLIGAPAEAAHCAHLEASFGSAPMAYAGGLLVSESAFGMARVQLDAAGALCASLPVPGPFAARVFLAMDQPVLAEATVQASALGAACDESCAATPLAGEAIVFSCVRGIVQLPTSNGLGTEVSIYNEEGAVVGSTTAGREVCVDARYEAEVSFGLTDYTCGEPIRTTAANVTCADEGACAAVQLVTCCRTNEDCDSSGDDDCDGTSDEGCECSLAVTCETSESSNDRCCTDQATCGERSSLTGECVAYEGGTVPMDCDSITVPDVEGGTATAPGCCRSEGQCGVVWDPLGCIAAADVPRVWGPSTTLAATSCTP
jgi:hypothetical protein